MLMRRWMNIEDKDEFVRHAKGACLDDNGIEKCGECVLRLCKDKGLDVTNGTWKDISGHNNNCIIHNGTLNEDGSLFLNDGYIETPVLMFKQKSATSTMGAHFTIEFIVSFRDKDGDIILNKRTPSPLYTAQVQRSGADDGYVAGYTYTYGDSGKIVMCGRLKDNLVSNTHNYLPGRNVICSIVFREQNPDYSSVPNTWSNSQRIWINNEVAVGYGPVEYYGNNEPVLLFANHDISQKAYLNVYEVRIYNTYLDDNERLFNYYLDKKKYNIV